MEKTSLGEDMSVEVMPTKRSYLYPPPTAQHIQHSMEQKRLSDEDPALKGPRELSITGDNQRNRSSEMLWNYVSRPVAGEGGTMPVGLYLDSDPVLALPAHTLAGGEEQGKPYWPTLT